MFMDSGSYFAQLLCERLSWSCIDYGAHATLAAMGLLYTCHAGMLLNEPVDLEALHVALVSAHAQLPADAGQRSGLGVLPVAGIAAGAIGALHWQPYPSLCKGKKKQQ